MEIFAGFGLFAVFIGLWFFASGKIKKLKAKMPGGFGLELEANNSTPAVKSADAPPQLAPPGTALHQLPRPSSMPGRRRKFSRP